MPKQEIAKNRPIRSACHIAAALFLPGTWEGRLFFYCTALLPCWPVVPHAVSAVCVLLFCIALVMAALRINESVSNWAVLIIPIACAGVFVWGIYLLAGLATGGSGFLDASPPYTVMTAGELSAMMAIMWLLLGVPNRAHALGLHLDVVGSAHRVVVKLLVAVSCALSGLVVMLLYFGGGSLRKPDLGPVLVGTLFMVVLLAPYYRKLADAIWRRGFLGAATKLGYLWEPWRSAMTELREAVRSNDNAISAVEEDPATSPPCEQAPESKSAAPDA